MNVLRIYAASDFSSKIQKFLLKAWMHWASAFSASQFQSLHTGSCFWSSAAANRCIHPSELCFCLLYVINTKKKREKDEENTPSFNPGWDFQMMKEVKFPSPILPIRNLPSGGDELHSLSLSHPRWHISILFCSLYLQAFTEAFPVQYFYLHGATQDVSFWQKGLWVHSLKY